MNRVMNRIPLARFTCAALVVTALLVPFVASLAQDSADGKSKAKGPRLPNYYAKVSTSEQQLQLRAVVKEYAPKIQQKRDELAALLSKRDAALDAILTDEQRAEIARLKADASSKQTSESSPAAPKLKKAKTKAKKAA